MILGILARCLHGAYVLGDVSRVDGRRGFSGVDDYGVNTSDPALIALISEQLKQIASSCN